MRIRRWWVLVALLVLIGADATWAAQADVIPQTTTVRLRRVAGIMALVPAVLMFVLSRYRRREYVRAWAAVWLCLAAPLFVFSIGADVLNLGSADGRQTRLAWGRAVAAGAALTWLGGMALLALSAGWVRGDTRWPRHVWPVTLVISATVMAGALSLGLVAVGTALWVGGLSCLVAGAVRFTTLARRERFAGALLIALALSAVPVHAALAQLLALAGGSVPDRVEVWIMVYAILALGMHLVVFEDVTYELRQQNVALHDAHVALKAKAVTDPLTGCYNRRFFDEVAALELQRYHRHGLPLSVVFIDCDRFKLINDRLGHQTGDRVLETIGRVLRAQIRQTDYAFRWGGDEFLLLLTCDEARAAIKAREIQAAFSAEPILRDLPTGVSLSAGWIGVPPDASELLTMVKHADERMYAAKRQSS